MTPQVERDERIEIRWVMDGKLPAALKPVVAAMPEPHVRTDRYEKSVHEAMNIKQRGALDRFDVKIRFAAEDAKGRGWAGTVEWWRRFALALDGQLAEAPSTWLAVKKRRFRSNYLVDQGFELADVPSSNDAMASVEVTELRVGDRRAWSIAVECRLVDEPAAIIDEALHRTGVCGLDGVALDPESSMAYPTWLFRLGSST